MASSSADGGPPRANGAAGTGLPHVSDAGAQLSARVQEQRTRVSVGPHEVSHTSAVEYAGAYYASGLDNSFSLARFRRDFKIVVHQLDDEELVFDMIGIDAAFANAFRRILLAEVPTMAIEKVFILNNTSFIQDEVLSHRLGLIPIRADARLFEERADDKDADEHNVIAFRLAARCERRRAGAGAAEASSEERAHKKVLSGELQWIPQGEQEARFRASPIAPIDDILIAKLAPGQEIELEAW